MTSMPATRYVKSGDVHIAYQVMGSGPIDLLYVPSWVSHLEHQLEEPRSADGSWLSLRSVVLESSR